jgi:tetratricopeptide (TPR) repeat protein
VNRKERRAAKTSDVRPAGARAPGGGASPLDPRALLRVALAAHQGGRLDEAEALYRRLLLAQPEEPDALHFLGVIAHQRGNPAEAIELISRAIARESGVAGYHSNLGEAHRALGQNEEAIRHYRRALALQPGALATRFGLGTALLDRGEPAAAAAEFEQVVRAEPRDAQARVNLANALLALDRREEAIQHYRAAIRAAPDYTEAAINLASVLIDEGALREAITLLADAVARRPDLAEAHYELGRALKLAERYEDATAELERAFALKPERAATPLLLAQILSAKHQNEEAIPWFERAAALAPDSIEPLIGRGLACLDMDRFEEALAWFEKALERQPASADAHFNIGLALQRQGRFEEAMGWHEKAIALDPACAPAHFHLALNRKHESVDDKVRGIERALAVPGLSYEQKAGLHFALAKAYDDIGDYDAAFAQYRAGNEERKRSVLFKPEDFTRYVDRMIAAFPKSLFARLAPVGSPSELPAFVLGMPRSGTTLVEQILASHPLVFGAGELDFMRQMTLALAPAIGTDRPFPECIALLEPPLAAKLASEHVVRLQALAPEALRVTDKLPNNFQRLGLIALLFPNARIFHCRRDPLDTCLSCYFQEFAHGQPFSFDLGFLGRFYRDYERLMAHWRTVLPTPPLDVPYEALVADQEGWSRRLVAHIGLDWDERCLAFHRAERQVHTASFWQVRQPIYSSSIGRWRHYAKHLGPLFEALGLDATASLPP